MARVSFTLRKTDGGSTLQRDPALLTDDDSALRGEAFGGNVPVPPERPAPSVPTFGSSSTLNAIVTDYETVSLQWNIGTSLAETLSADPAPTEIIIKYSLIGEPMAPADGSLVTTILPGQENYETLHTGLQEGNWIYYSLFAKYESTTLRPWYERLASLTVLLPRNYGSTDLLWSRVPEHYRVNDTPTDANLAVPSELFDKGPLYRMMSVFGWEMDRARTLTQYLMVQKDPDLATPEVLDALAYELGVELTSKDLGTSRLRGILSDIRYLREFKGTVQGVREWLTALSGCDVIIRPVQSNSLTTAQSTFTGTTTPTTNPADVPSGNEWVIEGTGVGASLNSEGLAVYMTGASGVAVARTRISNVEQAQWYRSYIDITNRSNAQVLGVAMSTGPLSTDDLDVTDGVVNAPYPNKFAYTPSFGSDDWYQMPTSIGIPGDGTLTTTPMYFSVFMLFNQADASLSLNNVVVQKDSLYPYAIDIYSQRANVVRDPQVTSGVRQATGASGPILSEAYAWTGGATSRWSAYSSGANITAYSSSGDISASVATGASVMIASTGACISNTPILLGAPYFVSVDDTYDKVVQATIVSRTYGVLAESSTVSFSKDLDSAGVRKYFRLVRSYEAPWLPQSVSDCYVVLHANLEDGETVSVKRPLLEAFNASGDYFDGDTVDGGWLQTSTVAGSIRDYRWGDAGQHVSFSYYTSEFQRTRNTIDRLIPSLIPVTQSVTLTDDNYNRIYGYTGAGLP